MLIKGYKSKLLVLALVSAMTVGCGGKEERKAKYLERGIANLESGDLDKANIEFKNVVQIDPKSSEGHYYLAQVAERLQEWSKAYGGYSKAVELDPENLDARAKLGQFNLLQANAAKSQGELEAEKEALDSAIKQRDEIFSQEKNHIKGRLLDMGIVARDGDIASAIAKGKLLIKEAPETIEAYATLSQLYSLEGDAAESIAILEQGVQANPEAEQLLFRLAQAYAKAERSDDAAEQMQTLIALRPETISYRTTLAAYYSQLGETDKAEQTLRDAIAVDEDNPESYLLLADFLLQRKSMEEAQQFLSGAIDALPEEADLYLGQARLYIQAEEKEQAIAKLNEIVDRWSKDVPGVKARNLLAKIHVQGGEIEKAKALLEEILAENPQDNEALLMRGKFRIQDGELDGAIADLRGVMKDQPNNAEVLGLLAQAHLQKGDLQLARDNLQRAVEAEPSNEQVRLRFARFLVAQKDYDLAEKHVNAVLSQNKESVPALITQSDIFAAKNDVEGLQLSVDNLKLAAPDSAEGYFRSGRILRAKGENVAALAEYEKALSLTQGAGEAIMLSEVVDLEIKMGKIDAAQQRVEAALIDNPDHLAANALLGRIQASQKNFSEAEASYEKHISLGSSSAQTYAELAAVRNAQGDSDGAELAYQDGLEKFPNDTRLLIGMAGLQERTGDFSSAMASYEKVLSNQSDNALATNNLAALIADHKSDEVSLARAKELANKLDQLPQPVFMDTVGWVYYRLGDYTKAVEKLTQVVEAAPEAAIFHYHLGMALAKAGDEAKAREHLQKAVDTGDFDGKDEAQEMLSSLK